MPGITHEHLRGRAWSPDSDDSDADTIASTESPRRESRRKKILSWLSSGRSHELPAHLEVQLGGAVVSTRRESAASEMGSSRSRSRSSSSAGANTIAAGLRASLVGSSHGLVSTRGSVDETRESPFTGWSFAGRREAAKGGSRSSGSYATTVSRSSGSMSESIGSGGTFDVDDMESNTDVSPRTSCRQPRPAPRIIYRSRPMSPFQVEPEGVSQPGAITAATALGSHPAMLVPSWSAASSGSPGRQHSAAALYPQEVRVEGSDGIGMGSPQSPSPSDFATAVLRLDVEVGSGSGSSSPTPRAVPTYTYDGSDWGGNWAGPGDQCSRRDTGFGSDRDWSAEEW